MFGKPSHIKENECSVVGSRAISSITSEASQANNYQEILQVELILLCGDGVENTASRGSFSTNLYDS